MALEVFNHWYRGCWGCVKWIQMICLGFWMLLILFEFGDPTIDGVGEGEFDPSSLSDLFCGVFLWVVWCVLPAINSVWAMKVTIADSFAAGHCHATRKLEERPAGQRDVSFVMSTFDYLQLSWQAAGRWVGGYQEVEECIKKSHHATWQHHQQKWPKQLETYVCIRSSCRKLVGNYIKTYVFFCMWKTFGVH